jgi:hypothetical protein
MRAGVHQQDGLRRCRRDVGEAFINRRERVAGFVAARKGRSAAWPTRCYQ